MQSLRAFSLVLCVLQDLIKRHLKFLLFGRLKNYLISYFISPICRTLQNWNNSYLKFFIRSKKPEECTEILQTLSNINESSIEQIKCSCQKFAEFQNLLHKGLFSFAFDYLQGDIAGNIWPGIIIQPDFLKLLTNFTFCCWQSLQFSTKSGDFIKITFRHSSVSCTYPGTAVRPSVRR